MWILGHTALAYLMVRFVFRIKKTEPRPGLLLYVFLFANIQDALHFGALRQITHNFIGAVLFPLLWIYLFEKWGMIRKEDRFLLLAAALCHLIGDFGFSSFLPLVRAGFREPRYWVWNSVDNLVAESVLGIVFLVILVWSGDLRRLWDRIRKMRGDYQSLPEATGLLEPVRFPYLLFLLYCAFAWGQFFLSLILNISRMANGAWYAWSFTGVFFLIALVLSWPLAAELCNRTGASKSWS